MRKSIFLFSSWLILTGMLFQSQSVVADDTDMNIHIDAANGKAIYDEGKGDATACVGCHGKKALGMDSMGAPRLANISQMYIIKQLNDYASGKRTDPGAAMNGIAKGLNEQDLRDVAAYLDSFEYKTEPSNLNALGKKVGNPKKGKLIMTEGIKPKVPACQDCHGFSGRSPNFPQIHHQKYVYLVNQLNSYRDGSRANDKAIDNVGIMRGIAKKLTDENIEDVAAYLSTVTNLTP